MSRADGLVWEVEVSMSVGVVRKGRFCGVQEGLLSEVVEGRLRGCWEGWLVGNVGRGRGGAVLVTDGC